MRHYLDRVAQLLAEAVDEHWHELSMEEKDRYREQAFAVDAYYEDLIEGAVMEGGYQFPAKTRAAA